MNLHLLTLLYILGFAVMAVLIALGLDNFPILTLSAVAIFLFVAFYNLVYTLLKIEQSIKEIKGK